jgi:hypothetical protein
MRDVTIRDYIGSAKELTAAEVRKLPAGTVVIRHSFDRYGTHQWRKCVIIGAGKTRELTYAGADGLLYKMPVRKETDRMCYTEVQE